MQLSGRRESSGPVGKRCICQTEGFPAGIVMKIVSMAMAVAYQDLQPVLGSLSKRIGLSGTELRILQDNEIRDNR